MKKFLVLAAVFTLIVGSVGIAGAFTWTEEYNGNQVVDANHSSFDFGFDLLALNWMTGVGTNSNLTLTQDAVLGLDGYKSGTFYATFYDTDKVIPEEASIKFTTYGYIGGVSEEVFSDIFVFNAGGIFSGDYIDYSYSLSQSQLDSLIILGYDYVTITADNFGLGANDFSITKVGLTVSTEAVPEPATLILLGSGFLGLVGFRKIF
jgi:PEP-CTERM motif